MTGQQMSDAERATRIELAAAYRLVAHFGWDDAVGTHLSVRVPGPERHFLINPFGMLFEEVTASSLVKIDLQGRKVAPSPHRVNEAGFIIHSAIHAAREDAHCVMHLHTLPGIAVSCQEQGLLPLNQFAMLFNGALAYHDYEGIALEEGEQPRLVRDLGAARAMILRNHGTLAVGRSVAEAFCAMYWLERSCAAQLLAQSGGAALRIPGATEQSTVARQAHWLLDEVSTELMWPAFVRKLDRIAPGFRD